MEITKKVCGRNKTMTKQQVMNALECYNDAFHGKIFRIIKQQDEEIAQLKAGEYYDPKKKRYMCLDTFKLNSALQLDEEGTALIPLSDVKKAIEQSDKIDIVYCTECEYSEIDATRKIPRLICTKCKDRAIDYNRFCSDAKRRK